MHNDVHSIIIIGIIICIILGIIMIIMSVSILAQAHLGNKELLLPRHHRTYPKPLWRHEAG